MKKVIILVAVLSLVAFGSPLFAMGGGEGNNTHCNGVGNPNSPCAGNTNNGGNGGNVNHSGNSSVKNKVRNNVSNNTEVNASSKNKNTNNVNQNQSVNNEGINVSNPVTVEGDKSTYEDNSVYIAPPATTPLVGTNSIQVTTPMGGAGLSRDAQYMIINFKMNKLRWAEQEGYITKEERIKHGQKLFKKFIRANNNNPLR